jgi:hypothetical protein
MTKESFYNFSIMMKENSKILFKANRNHTSVYLAGYVLEGYVKILLIHKGATTHLGNTISSYGGHIHNSSFINRLNSIDPVMFSNSILNQADSNYPQNLLNGDGVANSKDEWDINYRYEINRWTDRNFAQNIQNEIEHIEVALAQLRIDGVV